MRTIFTILILVSMVCAWGFYKLFQTSKLNPENGRRDEKPIHAIPPASAEAAPGTPRRAQPSPLVPVYRVEHVVSTPYRTDLLHWVGPVVTQEGGYYVTGQLCEFGLVASVSPTLVTILTSENVEKFVVLRPRQQGNNTTQGAEQQQDQTN